MASLIDEFKIQKDYSLWEQAAIKQLKGKALESIPQTALGLRPYYKKIDAPTNLLEGIALPAKTCKSTFHFEVKNKNEKEVNKQILEVLMHAADALHITLNEPCDFEQLLHGVHLTYIDFHFTVNSEHFIPCAKGFSAYLKTQAISSFSGSFCSHTNDLGKAISCKKLNGFQDAFTLRISSLKEILSDQIGELLGIAKSFLAQGNSQGLTINEIEGLMCFHFHLGSDMLENIAALRALRKNWDVLTRAFKQEEISASQCCIICETNSSLLESNEKGYSNILRFTIDQFVAYSGNASYFVLKGFDLSKKLPNSFSNRISSNIPVIMKEEAFMGKEKDPLGGSYYIEKATEKLVLDSWSSFCKKVDLV